MSGENEMRRTLALFALATSFVGEAFAQVPPDPIIPPERSIVAVPEDKRGGWMRIAAGNHMEVTLDDQTRLVTVLHSGTPGEADFDISKLSRTDETLVGPAEKTSMWASPGSLGFSVFVTADQTNLKVSNNTGTPVAYLAALYRGDPIDRNLEVTTRCVVESGKAAVESWPYLVDGMVILKFL
jgi:hypothetical protein